MPRRIKIYDPTLCGGTPGDGGRLHMGLQRMPRALVDTLRVAGVV